MAIPQNILDGRSAVELYRVNHQSIYQQNLEDEAVIIAHHDPLMIELLDTLTELGFSNLTDFFNQSEQADKDNEVPYEERWQ